MAWCFSDEATPFTENLLDRLANQIDSAVVPALWLYEVTNVPMLAVRKGRISRPKAAKFLDDLADLPIGRSNLLPPASQLSLRRFRL
jgi:hypothetical protein